MNITNIIELDKKYYMNTFGDRTPVCFTHGQGINLWDTNGKKYYDFLSGIAVNVLGHAHPDLVDSISQQAQRLIHCSNLYYIKEQALFAEKIVENSCADKVFFSNSGAEANEGAIKLARKYFKDKGINEKYEIITLVNSFHGRTMATLAATGQEKYQKAYTPLLPGFKHIPLNDIEALTSAIDEHSCAVMLELIQGESGVHPVSQQYIDNLVSLCKEKDLLLIVDEIQTGIGRTGCLFAYQHFNIEPDIFTLAKGLAGGVPIGAVCAKENVAAAFQPGDHGSTFGGNPLACAAGLAVLNTIEKNNLVENAKLMGLYMREQIENLKEQNSLIHQIRGIGLMIGIELNKGKAVELKNLLFDWGILVGSVGDSVIRILPPLILTKQDIDIFINALNDSLKALS
jgi:acetylornithine/N-succinyldiaminopimelate aminotransferase